MPTDTPKRIVRQNPTLLIGLGGTGKQVLLQLRRMFFDHYGVPTFGHIGHLWVDTDARNRTLDGKELTWFYEQVNFQARECVMVELAKSDLKNYFTERKSYPNIYSWLDPSLERHGEISDGAAQIRMFGRLAFFKHYTKIRNALQSTLDNIRNSANHLDALRTHGIEVDASQTDAWLVFSVAGGTGSGMFLDMAFALKHLDPNISVRGIIVLPSVFTRDFSHKIYGNAYAALMELEHYNFAKDTGEAAVAHLFPVQWTMEQFRAKETLRGPVFEMGYLIGNKPDSQAGELRVDQKSALCEMLAEYLFVEYGGKSGALATEQASNRSNLQDSLTSVVSLTYQGEKPGFTVTEEFCCRYGSIGLAKLHVPIQRVAALVRYRMAKDMVNLWAAPAAVPANFDSQIASDYYPRLRMRNNAGGRDGLFVRELGRGPSGESLEQILRAAVEKRRGEFLRSAANPDVGTRLMDWFQTEMMRTQLDVSNPDRAKWGVLSRQIQGQGLETLYQQISAELDRIVAEMVKAPNQGFTLARELLRRLSATLETARQAMTGQAQRARTQSERRRQEISRRLNWLGDVRGHFTRKTILDVAVDFCAEALRQELQAQLCEAAAQLSGRLSDLIGRGTMTRDASGNEVLTETGLLKQLSQLETDLLYGVQPLLLNHENSLSQLPDSPINISLLEEHDIQDFYVTRDGRPIDAPAMVDLSKRFFEETPEAQGGLWQMRDLLRRDGPGKAGELLLAFARRATPHLEERTVDALDRFARKYPSDSPLYVAELKRLLDNGMPWLASPKHHVMEGTAFRHKKQSLTMALCPTSPEAAGAMFRKRVGENSPEPVRFVDAPPDRAYFNSEMAGIPLLVTPDLDRYRNASYYSCLSNGLALHVDVNFEKFQDILVRNGDEAADYVEALRILGCAILAGTLRAARSGEAGSGNRIEFFYTDRTAVLNEDVNLGPLKLALRRLTEPGSEMLRNSIRTETDRLTYRMSDTERARFLVLLRHHGYHKPLGNAAMARVLDKVAEEIERANPELVAEARVERDRMKEWSVEKPAGSGIVCLPSTTRLEA